MSDPNRTTTDWVGTYQASRYAYAADGTWHEFALDGSEPPMRELTQSVTLITAWNPASQEHPLAWNEAANARLLRALVAAQVPWTLAWGGSLPATEPAWREDGFALLGLERGAACRWGRAWGQRALVHLTARSSELLFCEEDEAIPCGLRRFSLEGVQAGAGEAD